MREFYAAHKETLNKTAIIAAFILAVYVFTKYIFHYIVPFCFGYIFSLAAEPLAAFLNKRLKIGRGIAALICLALMMTAVVTLSASLISNLLKQAYQFAAAMPEYLLEVSKAVESLKYRFTDYMNIIPTRINGFFDNLVPRVIEITSNIVGTGVQDGSLSLVSKMPNFLMNFLFFIISAFFFIKDRSLISEAVREKTPATIMKHCHVIKKGLLNALLGYIKAQGIIMCVVIMIDIVGLIILKYPYALFMGIVIGVVDAMPIVGSGLILWPWAAFNLITGNYYAAAFLMGIYVVNIITRQFMEPKVISAQIGLHPIATLASIYVGLRLFGIFGFFIGPALLVCLKVVYAADASSGQAE
ncbi:MAG: sporulation integral membrane protein YtvI [Clostridiales bacterium]|jgi:sporulation integral membrane protein YtvI|nr:sporulation integral membrane protein YtvI [Clostridiales bacterium]